MTRTLLDDAQWVSLMLVLQQIPLAWKRDEVALRRFVEAALWVCRTGAPWRDLPKGLGCWSSVYHRWRRWCLRGWWELVLRRSARPCPQTGCCCSTAPLARPTAPRAGRRAARPPPRRSVAAVAGCAQAACLR